MSNVKLHDRAPYGVLGMNARRARRAERQFFLGNLAVAGAFLFVSAVVLGLVG